VDAVVHLAAIPAPGLIPNAATFMHNVGATYHIFAAARLAKIKRVVWASSETLLGLALSPENPPPYIPVDEEYPARPESSYSLSKHVEETIAAQFCRWDPELTMVGLRFSNVMEPGDYARFPSWQDDPSRRIWNVWGYIDARDGAQAVRLALDYPRKGLDIFVIANADTVMERPSAELAAESFPDVPVTRSLAGNETLLSIEKARRLLGYEPRYTWRDHVES
jgi:nucleoside-diphosphate-sugar epimerase